MAWYLLGKVVTEARSKASHAMACLVEQQEENAVLKTQVGELTESWGATRQELEAAQGKLKEARRELRSARRKKAQASEETTGVRVAVDQPRVEAVPDYVSRGKATSRRGR